MSDIIIAGSANFIGSNLCNYLVQHTKYNIASLDNLSTTPDLQNLQPSINSKYRHTFYLAEAESPRIVEKIFELEKPKVIIYNLAATHLDAIGDFRMIYTEAIKILNMWLNLALLYGVDKFIILSNSKVLYKQLSVEQQEFASFCEQATIDFSNKFDVYLLKHCNAFGPRQSLKAPVPKIFTSVLKQDFKENLENDLMDWIYIKDLFFNVLNFIEHKHTSRAYYIRNKEHMSCAQIYELAQGIKNDAVYLKSKNVEKYDIVNQETIHHEYFKWAPQYKLNQALEHTFCWYNANKWAWR